MKKAKIQEARRHINDGALEDRLRMAGGYLEQIEQELPLFDPELAAVAGDYRNASEQWTGRRCSRTELPRLNREHIAKANIKRLGKWGYRIAEGLLAAAVGISMAHLNPVVAIVLGLGIGWMLTYASQGLALHFCRGGQPKAAQRRLGKATLVASILLMVALVPLVLAMRTDGGSGSMVNMSLVLLAVILPTLGGLFAAEEFLLRWSERHTKAYRELQNEKLETLQFRKELQDLLDQNDGNPPPAALPDETSTIRPIEGAARGVVLTMMLVTMACCGPGAQVQASQFQELLECKDTSGSPDADEMNRVCQVIADQLPAIAERLGLNRVSLLFWSSSRSCWTSPQMTAVIPGRSVVERPSLSRSESDWLFPDIAKRRQKAAAELCDRQQAELDAEHQEVVKGTLRPLAARLRSPGKAERGCTAVPEILKRSEFERPGTLMLIITDGLSDCAGSTPGPRPSGGGSNLVIVLVPAKQDVANVGQALNERRCALQRFVPKAKIVYSFQVTADERWLIDLVKNTQS